MDMELEYSMNREKLIKLLAEIDTHLSAPCDIIILGGAAMILHFRADRATRDIDMLLLRGDINELRQTTRKIAREYNLPENWMSDAAKGFAIILPSDFYHRLSLLEFPFYNLNLYALGIPEQVAMKIIALREQDLEDLELLIPLMSEDDKNILLKIMHHVSKFRNDWAQKIQYFMEELGWKIE